jgi:hypothetical protein
MCPLQTSEGKMMVKNLVSEENLKKAGVKVNSAYVSCPKDAAADHKGFFVVEADSASAVTNFFGAMKVEVRSIQPLSEIVKTL